jgi:prepilin-type processing-associated H-X9-DG protein
MERFSQFMDLPTDRVSHRRHNVLYLDGHVDFVSDTVDLGVWRGMASIDGREIF